MVEVVAPGGRLRKAQIAARLSARVSSAPPWRLPPVVDRSGLQASRPVTTSGEACSSVTPLNMLKGMAATSPWGSMVTLTSSPPSLRQAAQGLAVGIQGSATVPQSSARQRRAEPFGQEADRQRVAVLDPQMAAVE